MSATVAPRGLIAPALTPFSDNDEVDYGRFRDLVEYLFDRGMHGVSPGGSTGEGAALDDTELGKLVTVAREVAGERPVVAGVIRTSTKAAVRTAKVARDAGATALMVTPTFYNVLVPDETGNTDFYTRISDAVDLPIIIYNVVPQNEISASLFSRLYAEVDHVAGVKQSVGGVLALADMRVTVPEAAVYAATDELIYTCFTLGAAGAISAVLSLFPEQVRTLWDHAQQGRHAEALPIQNELFKVWKVVRGPQFPVRMKAAAAILGRDLGTGRSPASPVSPQVRSALEAALTPLI